MMQMRWLASIYRLGKGGYWGQQHAQSDTASKLCTRIRT